MVRHDDEVFKFTSGQGREVRVGRWTEPDYIPREHTVRTHFYPVQTGEKTGGLGVRINKTIPCSGKPAPAAPYANNAHTTSGVPDYLGTIVGTSRRLKVRRSPRLTLSLRFVPFLFG